MLFIADINLQTNSSWSNKYYISLNNSGIISRDDLVYYFTYPLVNSFLKKFWEYFPVFRIIRKNKQHYHLNMI